MWDQLKNIIRQTSDKAVIIEDGEPRFVVLTVQEYNRLRDILEGATDNSVPSLQEHPQQSVENPEQTQNTEPKDQSQQSHQEQDYELANKELSSLEIDESARDQAEKMLRPE